MREYCVTNDGRVLGTVTVQEDGLYTLFCSVCTLEFGNIFRLRLCCGDVTMDLGVLTPENGIFRLQKRMPTKRIPKGELAFTVVTKTERTDDRLTRVYSDQPFPNLQNIQNAYLIIQGEDCAIGFR